MLTAQNTGCQTVDAIGCCLLWAAVAAAACFCCRPSGSCVMHRWPVQAPAPHKAMTCFAGSFLMHGGLLLLILLLLLLVGFSWPVRDVLP